MYINAVSPVILGIVAMFSLALLLTGLFTAKITGTGRRALWTVFTCLIIVLKSGILFQVAHALVHDDSLERSVGAVILVSLALAVGAFIHGSIYKFRRQQGT